MARVAGMGRVATLCAVVVLVAAHVEAGGILGVRTRIQALRDEIEKAVARVAGADVAVAYRRLAGHEELLIHPDDEFHAASTMKIPVMIELFRQAKAGTVALDTPMPVRNAFTSIADGSAYQLSVSDDSDGDVYKAIGTTMTPRQLCESMITRSSNLAANILIERLGPANIQKAANSLGARGMHVLRGVEDNKAFAKGLNNETTARALAILLEKIADGKAVDREASAEMLAILKRQQFNDAISAGLPPGTVVAHKTGTITAVAHDAAVVYGKHPYVLVVLTRNIPDEKVSKQLIANISTIVWKANE